MSTDLKIGDMVKVKDGSWAVCVSKEWNEETKRDIIHPYIGLSTEPFRVVYVREVWEGLKIPHDIYIQSTLSNQVYLHSSNMVEKEKPEWFKGAKRGDRFWVGNKEYILVHSGFSYLSLVSTANGNCWSEAIKCKGGISITKEEFEKITRPAVAKDIYETKH